jgi:hypothetical protein
MNEIKEMRQKELYLVNESICNVFIPQVLAPVRK